MSDKKNRRLVQTNLVFRQVVGIEDTFICSAVLNEDTYCEIVELAFDKRDDLPAEKLGEKLSLRVVGKQEVLDVLEFKFGVDLSQIRLIDATFYERPNTL